MVQGGMSCIKYILFVFNLIFTVFGGLLIYSGVLMIQEQSQTFAQLIETPNTLAISVIVLGFAIFVVAFLGCSGALFESHCILLAFGIIVTVILALELTIAGLAFAFKSDLRNVANRELKTAVTKYNWTESSDRYTQMIDQMQATLKCCGFNSTRDYPDLNPNPVNPNYLPDSCCPDSSHNHTLGETIDIYASPAQRSTGRCRAIPSVREVLSNEPDPHAPYSTDCVNVFVDSLLTLIGPLGLACLALALFQLMGIIFAFSLSKAVRREYQVV